jgi:hypothetical protein
MLENPVTMGELKNTKKKLPKVSMQQKPKAKRKSATQAMFIHLKETKRRK